NIFYRATPYFTKKLMEEGYNEVCKLDADQVILGSLEDIWNGNFDVAVVRNDPSWPISVWDITHPSYYNNGLVVLKSKEFVDHWLKLCYSSHFNNYQYREQDFLTLLCSDYFNYKVKVLDTPEKLYGEVAKPHWTKTTIKNNKVMIDQAQLYIYHAGGGNIPNKMNYKIKFQPEVVKFLDRLVKP
ncbi:MAG: hypothetical protein AABY22_35245, partial [Nanoarchaeota archaeon]